MGANERLRGPGYEAFHIYNGGVCALALAWRIHDFRRGEETTVDCLGVDMAGSGHLGIVPDKDKERSDRRWRRERRWWREMCAEFSRYKMEVRLMRPVPWDLVLEDAT